MDLLDRYSPSQIVEALAPRLGAERCARIDRAASGRLAGVAALFEDLRDPHNLGAVLRSCEAMGVTHVHVVSTLYRFRTSPRVTQGAEKWLDLARWHDVDGAVAALHKAGFALYCGVPGARLTVGEIDVGRPVALAFGNEHTGLSPRLLALADGAFTIPMYGFAQSFNVSVSAAVTLHVVTEARRRLVGKTTDLDDDAVARLRARYYALDLRGAEEIVARHVSRAAE